METGSVGQPGEFDPPAVEDRAVGDAVPGADGASLADMFEALTSKAPPVEDLPRHGDSGKS